MDVRELSNRELVRRLAEAGPDDAAWLEFITRFSGRLRAVLYRSYLAELGRSQGVDAGSPAGAVDDLTQEVFLRLLEGNRRALAGFEGRNENSIYTYLFAIGLNLVRDHFKKLRAQKSLPAASSLEEPVLLADGSGSGPRLGDTLASPNPGPDAAAEWAELRSRMIAALDQISTGATGRRDRLIFRLHFLEGLTLEEIAGMRSLGLSYSGVEKRVRKIRRALQEALGDLREQGGLAVGNSSR